MKKDRRDNPMLILRQNCLRSAVQVHALVKKSAELEDVLKTADEMVKWVLETKKEEKKE